MTSLEASPARRSRLFRNVQWLGFRHDGYPVVPMLDYLEIRPDDALPSGDDVLETNRRKVAATMQSLLTFGLLEAVTEQHVPESTLVTIEAGRPVLSKANVPALVQDWVERVQRVSETLEVEELGRRFERVHAGISRAHALMTVLSADGFAAFDVLGDDAPGMFCLIAAIGEALETAKKCFPLNLPPIAFSWKFWNERYLNLLREELLADGWCPSMVTYFASDVYVSSMEYISACGGPIQDGKRHDTCSAHACAAYVVDEKTHRPKHTESCAAPPDTPCEYAAPPLDDIQQLLIEGEVPVVTWKEGLGTEPARIRVHKASEVQYIAFSHVWADGLGSNTETGLPTCQLRKLAHLSRIIPDAAFWIDSLCIPQADHVRKRAIGLMGRTYRDAVAVVVLDSGLQLCPSTAPRSLLMLRMLTSGWMRRLWTLQEVVLNGVLFFVFADTTLPLLELLPSPTEILLVPRSLDLRMRLFHLMVRLLVGAAGYSLADVAASLQWRTTNRPADETLAIASLLDVDAAALVDCVPQERMVRLLQALRKLPRGILFLDGAKLDVDGFRWAPASFMVAHGGGAGFGREPPDATLTARGLEATYYVMVIPKTTFTLGVAWTLLDRKTGSLCVVSDAIDISSLRPGGGGEYTCDMLLLLDSTSNKPRQRCVAVLIGGAGTVREVTDPEFTVHCMYQQRLVIHYTIARKGTAEVIADGSGWVPVCVR